MFGHPPRMDCDLYEKKFTKLLHTRKVTCSFVSQHLAQRTTWPLPSEYFLEMEGLTKEQKLELLRQEKKRRNILTKEGERLRSIGMTNPDKFSSDKRYNCVTTFPMSPNMQPSCSQQASLRCTLYCCRSTNTIDE
jgi:hypothetical protein